MPFADQRLQLRVRQFGGQIGLDRLRLERLARRPIRVPGVAVGLLGLAAPLALAPQHGQLVRVTVLGRLLQLREHQPQRRDTVALPRLHGGGDVRLDAVGNLHPPSSVRPSAAPAAPDYPADHARQQPHDARAGGRHRRRAVLAGLLDRASAWRWPWASARAWASAPASASAPACRRPPARSGTGSRPSAGRRRAGVQSQEADVVEPGARPVAPRLGVLLADGVVALDTVGGSSASRKDPSTTPSTNSRDGEWKLTLMKLTRFDASSAGHVALHRETDVIGRPAPRRRSRGTRRAGSVSR